MKTELQDLMAKGETEQAIEQLLTLSRQVGADNVREEILLLSARYEEYAKNRRLGTSSPEEQQLTLSRINHALMDLIGRIQEDGTFQVRRGSVKAAAGSKDRPRWQWVVGAGVIIGILGGIAELSGFNLKDLFASGRSGSNTVTVLVHGASGKDELVLPNRGIVKLIYGQAVVSEQINNEGEATFKEIEDRFFEPEARVEVLFHDPEGEPYRAIHQDSSYRLRKGQYLSLPVKLYGLEQIRGIVKNFETGDPVEGARVSIQGEEAFSDRYGEYTLEIPKEKQRQFQTIRAFHEQFQSYEMQQVPIQTGREIPILLEPKPN